jgi:DNA-binding beta-propeller fold protein YncE
LVLASQAIHNQAASAVPRSLTRSASNGAASTDDSVARIDPQISQIVATITVPRWPENLAVSPGTVWVADFSGDSVSRIDPQTNQIVGEPIVTGAAPISIAIGEGSAWVAHAVHLGYAGAPGLPE